MYPDLSEVIDELRAIAEDMDLDDEDELKRGYRRGYYDAVLYLLDWLEELNDEYTSGP